MKKKIKYIKLDADDILEILLEHYQEQFKGCLRSKGIILGTPGDNLRFIGAFANEQAKEFADLDLEIVEKELPFNGDHSFLKANPEFCIKNTDK